MMQLRRLLLLGLPACGSTAPKPEPPPKPVETVHAKPPIAYPPFFDPKQCKVDQVTQSLCGHYDGTCRIDTVDESNSYWRNELATRANTSGWLYDPATSKEWREREAAEWPTYDNSSDCCVSACFQLDVAYASPLVPATSMNQRGQPEMRLEEWCFAKPNSTAAPAPGAPDCPQGVRIWHEARPFEKATETECCYQDWVRKMNPGGRPARVDGVAQFADVVRGDAWQVALPELPVDPERAVTWLEQARMEHASVAAFAATSLRLLAHGAPPELIAGAHHAALDELRHAQIAFALASAYSGTPLSPARFDAAAAMTGAATLVELAVETFVDGCIGETLGAIAAAQAAAEQSDPSLAALLRGIAEDEARHADLAWRIVCWCVQREPTIVKLLAVGLGYRQVTSRAR